MSSEALLARQPIFDQRLEVVGYELLFRGALHAPEAQSAQDGDLMTAQVMVDAFILGIDRLAGGKHLFINADRRILTGAVPIVFPPEKTVVEVLHPLALDDDARAGVSSLAQAGYTIALDGFGWFDGAEELLKLAAYVKIDVRSHDLEEIEDLLERVRAFGVKSVALKVETWDELEKFTELGFDLFQGYVLSRPQVISEKTLVPSQVTNLRLAAELADSDGSFEKVVDLVRVDPALGYRVLQAASEGPERGLRRNVRTLNDALVMLGWRRLQSWVILMLLVEPKSMSSEQVSTALIRARLCELLASQVDPAMANAAYLTGLLASMDLLLGVPVESVVKTLDVAPEITTAVVGLEGRLGRVLAEAEFLQLGIGAMDYGAGAMLDSESMQSAYLDAVHWGDEMTRALLSVGDPQAR
ncbi:MAG: EAL domain-containing protein [Actinomycetota bacterium]|nr:EAL domain-containing protein [Actinomycetota bacterium]